MNILELDPHSEKIYLISTDDLPKDNLFVFLEDTFTLGTGTGTGTNDIETNKQSPIIRIHKHPLVNGTLSFGKQNKLSPS